VRVTAFLLVLLATLGCFTPRAVSDLVHPSPVRGVSIQATETDNVILIVSEYQCDPGPNFSLEDVFRPITTRRRAYLSLPPDCTSPLLRMQTRQGTIEALQADQPTIVYWRDMARYPEPIKTESPCVLWISNTEREYTNPPQLIISVQSEHSVDDTPVPEELPWRQPKRWGWLAISPILDTGFLISTPFLVLALVASALD